MHWPAIGRRPFLGGSLALGICGLPAWANEGARPRILVSSDIGGTDPDDFQSMIHLLLLADTFDLEGIVSSPFGPGRLADIMTVVDMYERDFPNLASWSHSYPTPGELRAIAKQGATHVASYRGFDGSTEGSEWIVHCSRKDDPRPLYLLVWGGIEDLAQALQDAPDILPRLRVYFIGGPNKKWSPDAYAYIVRNHPDLWIIEANSTYRGWFEGGDQSGDWSNDGFVARYVAEHGALGEFFANQLAGTIKMGDSPSVSWARGANPQMPSNPGWGGQYVRAGSRASVVFDRLTTANDTVEAFAIVEYALPLVADQTTPPKAWLIMDNQRLAGHWDGAALRFRVSPKEARRFDLRFESEHHELDGQTAAFTATRPATGITPDVCWPNWWTDDPDLALAEGQHAGARSINRWRHAFLGEFAERMRRCSAQPQ